MSGNFAAIFTGVPIAELDLFPLLLAITVFDTPRRVGNSLEYNGVVRFGFYLKHCLE